MKKVHGLLTLGMAVLALVGCSKDNKGGGGGGEPTKQTFKLHGQEYVPIDKAGLTSTDTSVSGTGSLLFVLARPEDNSYKLSFTLEKGGSLTLVTNANETLKNGANLKLIRGNDDKLNVHLTVGDAVCVPGTPQCDLSSSFADINATQKINLTFDVHGHGHVVYFEKGTTNVKEEFAMARVAGKHWGLKLDKATATQALVGAALDPH